MNQHNYYTGDRTSLQVIEENARFMSRVYRWMTLGVLITGFIAYWISHTEAALQFIFQNKAIFWILLIAQIGLVFTLAGFIQKISATAATIIFLLYASLTGVTFSSIFIVYTQSSIQSAFFTTAFSFAGLSAFGYFTRKDLGPLGSFLTMGLFGLIGFGLLSLFFPSMMGGVAGTVYGIAGIIIFAGLTAYDTQKIKQMNIIGNEGTDEDHKEAIQGALKLYLDFINLFLFILRFMGDRRH